MQNASPEESAFVRDRRLSVQERRQKSNQKFSDEDEVLDLTAAFDFVHANWTALLTYVLAGMACAAVIYAVTPSKWKASVIVEIGQMPYASRESTLIESPHLLIERLKLRETQEKIIAVAGLSPERVSTGFPGGVLKVTPIKDTHFIKVSVTGFSTEETKKTLSGALRVVLEMHGLRRAPTVERLADQLREYNSQIAAAKTERSKLQKLLADVEKLKPSDQLIVKVVVVSLLEQLENKIRTLSADRMAVEEMTGPTKNYPTAVVDGAEADPVPYSPALGLLLAVGAVLGLLSGAVLSFYRNRKNKFRLAVVAST